MIPVPFAFPEATRQQPHTGKPGGQLKLTYQAEKVVTNDPAFDNAIFAPEIPPGWHVARPAQLPAP